MVRLGDNSGVMLVRFIRVIGRGTRRYAKLGELMLASVKRSKNSEYRKGQLINVLLVNSRYPHVDLNGVVTTFKDNVAVLVKQESAGLRAQFTRVNVPVLESTLRLFVEKSRSIFKLIV